MFLPLGDGNVDIASFVVALETQRYDGWYVIEQDAVLDSEPGPGEGPMVAARRSVVFLENLARDL